MHAYDSLFLHAKECQIELAISKLKKLSMLQMYVSNAKRCQIDLSKANTNKYAYIKVKSRLDIVVLMVLTLRMLNMRNMAEICTPIWYHY